MIVQSPYSVVANFLKEDNLSNIFDGKISSKSGCHFGRFHYRSDEPVLSELCSAELYSIMRKLMTINDRTVASIIMGATYSGSIPFKFKVVESITEFLVLIPIVIMFFDFFFAWTELSSLFYIYASACAASLLVTAKIAKKEWMVRNWNGKK